MKLKVQVLTTIVIWYMLKRMRSSFCLSEDNGRPSWQRKEEKEAIDRLVSDLPEDEEDYLDLTLEEEREFLTEYQALIKSLKA